MTTRFEEVVATDTSAGVADAYALVLLNASGYLDITLFGGELGGLAGLSANGLVARTGAGVYAARTLTAPAAGITVTNGDGVAGNPTLALANDLAALEALATTGIPCRTAADTWAARTLTAPAAGITITNPAGVAGNPTLVLANDLAAVEGLATTGIARRTASNTWTASNNVTLAEMASMTASKLLGRATASGAGVPQEIGLSTGLAWSALNIIVADAPLSALSAQANNTVVGNVSGSSAAPIALTAAQLATLIGAFTSVANGVVPASGGGTTNFLRADATFANPIASIPTLAHGTYTPTLANISNGNVLTPSVCQYMRVGNTVTVSGKFNASVTTGTTQTIISVTLPIASALANDTEGGGAGGGVNGTTLIPLYVNAEPTNNVARVIFVPPNTTARDYWFTFTYLVI